jgi:hypothetical protein
MEKLRSYFEKAEGRGVIATSDKDGKVNAAVYSRPHFFGGRHGRLYHA